MKAFRKLTFAFVAGFLPERFPRFGAAATACLLAFALLPGAPAGAQTPVKLVGNTGQTAASGDHTVGRPSGLHELWSLAQVFTTGPNAGGYTLSSVDVRLASVPAGASPRVSIHSVIFGSAGVRLHELTNPASVTANAVNTFTAAPGATLDANTTYAVVLETTRPGKRYTVKGTASGAQDSGAASGWSIADTSRRNNRLSGIGWAPADQALMIAVNGTPGASTPTPPTPPPPPPVASAVTVSNLGQTTGSTLSFTFDLASSFTTGSESSGYLLTRLDIDMNNVAGTPGYSVSIWSDSSDFPGSSVGTLTNPASLSVGVNSFTASGNGIKLNPGTKYWVVFDSQTAGLTSWSLTSSSAEDSGAAAGWSIGDSTRGRSTAQSTWDSGASTQHMRFAVHARVAPPVVSNAPFTVTADAQNVYIHLTKDINTGSTGSHPMSGQRCPASQAFTLKVNGVAYGSWATRGVTGGPAGGNGLDGWRAKCTARQIHLELWNGPGYYEIPAGSTVTLSYDPNLVWTGPERGRVTYADGTVVPAFTDKAVENNTPHLKWASVNGTDLLAYFGYSLATWSVPAPSAFTVTVNGTRRNVVANGVSFFGNYNAGVKLVLASPVEHGDTVTFAYDAPSANPLRARRGPVVPDVSSGVTNDTPDPAVWSAKLTAKHVLSGNWGCWDGFQGSLDCSRTLTDDSFTWKGTSYRFIRVTRSVTLNNEEILRVELTNAISEEWTLHVDDVPFPVANGILSNGGKTATWANPGARWSNNQQVSLRLTTGSTSGAGGAGGNSGPSPTSSQVSGTKLKMTFDEPLAQGLAPPGGSFKVTVGPGPQGGARGNGGGFGGGFGVGAQATSGDRTTDIPGTGTVTVDGANVTVTLARPVPPGSTVTVGYTPPDEDENALRDLEGAKVEEFSGEPVAHGAPAANRAPVVDEGSSNYAGFVAQGNAPRGVLVTKGFHGMFSDPDGDELTYTVALSDPAQAALVETLHVPTEAELAETPRRIEVARRVFFRADAEADWDAMEPAVPDPVSIAVTVTATDPEGLTASVEGVFLTHWAAPRVESVAVASNAGSDDTYALGETIRVAVRFDEPVRVDTSGGAPRIKIDMDPADWGAKWASYAGGSGTRELVFAYEVTEPNYSAQGIAVLADTLETNGGTIRLDTSYRSAPWMDADLGHPGLGHDPKHKVDWGLAPAPAAAAPAVTGVAVASDAGPDDTYALGDVIRVAVTFDAVVTVTGSPDLAIDMDPADWGEKRAAYESGSGTASLVFAHTVVEPNYSTEGIAVLANSLATGGGTIRSASGADAALAHPGLAHDASHKVDWRPELSVADARADEGAGATVDFVVSLSRAFTTAAHAVTVDYATSNGTATAGEDYTAASGTLTFAAGETVKTVRVALLDDAIDEGSETFSLRLSNATGARIADGEATGTIVNSDPMPRAWLARFGRAAAEHVTGAIGERLRGSPGTRVRLGGHELDWSADPDALPANGSALLTGPDPRLTGGVPLLTGANGFGRGLNERTGEDGEAAVRELSMPDLLLASSFHMASAGGGSGSASGRWSVWGRGARSSFEGTEGRLTLEGDVTTATLGMDYERGLWLAGVALSRSSGEGSYEESGMRGEVESSLTGVYPYARYRVSESLSLWGVVGFGAGDMTLEPEGTSSIETDIETGMAAAGARGVLLPARAAGGFELALRADLMATATSSDAAANLAETEVETSRIRLLLEASRSFRVGAASALAASVEAGLRYDGGDAETGSGLEAGGSLRWSSGSLSVEVAVRGLMAHSEDNYEEWGVSGSVQYAPGADGRGFSLRAGSAWGAAAGSADRIWSQRAAGLAGGEFAPGASVDAEAGYGFGFRGGLLTPYTGVALSDSGDTWRAGARWKLGAATEVSLEANLTEPASGDDPESGVLLKGSRRW